LLTLYIVRHGETEWNIENKLQGWKDSSLTNKGIEHSLRLQKRLEPIPFQLIYTSPSGRAVHTANLIKGLQNIEVKTVENLKEIHLGPWEGKSHDEVKLLDPERYDHFWNAPHLYKADTGETFVQLQQRVENFLSSIVTEHTEGNILIVTHTVFIKMLLAFVKQLPISELWGPPYIKDTSLSVIEIENNHSNILLEADIEHLLTEEFI
jgi:broad specificity phosphatase PhoE